MRTRYKPMLAAKAEAPFSSSDWYYEIKWDGIRAVAYVDTDLSILSRNGVELRDRFPELQELADLAPGTVLDGEIVTMAGGRPDIQPLLTRMHSARPNRASRSPPVTYIVFDILEQDGRSLIGLPLSERRKILEKAVREGRHVVRSDPVIGKGTDYYEAAVRRGLEGIMAKRMDSMYEPGIRSTAWLKIAPTKTCDCLVLGYTPGRGGRSGTLGALVLGLYDNRPVSAERKNGKGRMQGEMPPIAFVGKVGTGFSDQLIGELLASFSHITAPSPPPGIRVPEKGVTWLFPFPVAEIAYQEVTRDGKLRIPRFIRIRTDKDPLECGTDQLGGGASPQPSGSSEKRMPGGTAQKIIASDLRKYQDRRDFNRTREPAGGSTGGEGENSFVVQEHHAHRLHYDLRLERDGVLKSWAVPKGIPLEPGEKHLAVAVEDHPLEYGSFEGTIPKGEYGAGTVTIWDRGTYTPKLWEEKKIEVLLHGKRLSGRYVLVQFRRAGKDEWLLFRAGD